MCSTDFHSDTSASTTSTLKKTTLKQQKPKPIHSHIRDFTGIIETVYGSTSASEVYQTYDLGRHASYYLQAHGYSESIIQEIQKIWLENTNNMDNFVNVLTSHGMAATEVQWFWDLIQHKDICGM